MKCCAQSEQGNHSAALAVHMCIVYGKSTKCDAGILHLHRSYVRSCGAHVPLSATCEMANQTRQLPLSSYLDTQTLEHMQVIPDALSVVSADERICNKHTFPP